MENEKNSLIERLKEDAMMGLIEGLLPQIQPFIGPAMKKLEDYFGDDEKIFVMKRIKGGPVRIFVFDNTKGNYEVSKYTGVGEDGKTETENVFSADKSVIIAVHDTSSFVQDLLTGKFTAPLELNAAPKQIT